MKLLSLNLDVVQVILSLIRPYDALQLALTCRAAHTVAIPRFLSEVVLGHEWRSPSSDQILRFCTFMLADTAHRLRHLKALTLHNTAFSAARNGIRSHRNYEYSSVAPLSHVLLQANRLRRISVYRAEYVLRQAPEFSNTLVTLPSVEDLQLFDVGLHTLDTLSALTSCPQKIELEFLRSMSDGASLTSGQHRFLHNFTQSLVVLKLSRPAGVIEQLEPDTVWSAVQELEIWGDISSLAPYATAFPNLRSLHLPSTYVEDVMTPIFWSRIDHLVLSSPVFLSGQIRHLELRYYLDALPTLLFDQWSAGTMALLQKTSPVVLACYPNMQVLRCITHTVPSLRLLQLFTRQLIYPNKRKVEDVESWITAMIPTLAEVPLIGITLAISMEDSEEVSHLLRLARVIASQICSLEYVGLNLMADSHTWTDYPYTWYKVVSRPKDGLPGIKKMPGGDIIERQLLATPRT